MPLQDGYLYKHILIVLLRGHKRSDNIFDEVSAAFGHRVQKSRGCNGSSDKVARELFEPIRL